MAKRKGGRPKEFDGPPVSVRLSDDVYAQLYAIAKAHEVDVAVVIREAIAQRIIDERRATPR